MSVSKPCVRVQFLATWIQLSPTWFIVELKILTRRGYENAFWSNSGFCMTYGDGATTFQPLVSVDVAGHEMSHGVMSTEANLTYSGESGGLNESN